MRETIDKWHFVKIKNSTLQKTHLRETKVIPQSGKKKITKHISDKRLNQTQ